MVADAARKAASCPYRRRHDIAPRPFTQAQGALGAASALGNTSMAAFVAPTQPGILNVPPGQPVQAIAAVNNAFSGSALLAGAQTAVGFINRMAANLANAST